MDDFEKTKMAYITTFSTPDGTAVLTDILNDLGFFATDGSQDPKLVSVANGILMKMGAYSPETLERYVSRLIDKGGRK